MNKLTNCTDYEVWREFAMRFGDRNYRQENGLEVIEIDGLCLYVGFNKGSSVGYPPYFIDNKDAFVDRLYEIVKDDPEACMRVIKRLADHLLDA